MDKANIPRTWLMTDQRVGDGLFEAIARLPTRSGVVFRHRNLAPDARRVLGTQVAALCKDRQLILAVSRDVLLAEALGADLVHNPATDPFGFPVSVAVHSLDEAAAANRRGAKLAFVSPLFATRSHADATPLSRSDARAIVSELRCPAIALGGMDAQRFADLDGLGFYGWAGIDAWLRI